VEGSTRLRREYLCENSGVREETRYRIMSRKSVLFVGGCPAPYHRLEPAEPHVRKALESIGLDVQVRGIFHPDGTDAFVGDYSSLTADNLSGFDAVVLFTTGKSQGADPSAIVDFVRGGKALIGIHGAADSFLDHADYVAMIGARFRTHPAQLDVAVEYVDAKHPVTAGLAPFTAHDELYLFTDYDPARVHLLAQTRSYAGDGPNATPICWTREEGGRVFYLSLGHNPEVMASADWQTLFTQGVRWAIREI